ncbi:hypothetical protein SABIM44S_03507 [Streptomyces abikoensis]
MTVGKDTRSLTGARPPFRETSGPLERFGWNVSFFSQTRAVQPVFFQSEQPLVLK